MIFFETDITREKDRQLQGILISIAGTRGGVGKTLTLAHFLKRLQEMKKRIAVISNQSNELHFLLSQALSDQGFIHAPSGFDLLKLPHCDYLPSLKSKYDVILHEVSNSAGALVEPMVLESDTCLLLSTPEPLSQFLLKQECSQLLKNNPHRFHIVFNRLNFANEFEFLVQNMKNWDLDGLSLLPASFIPEDQALLDDLMRKDVFHSNYLQRISGQSWRQLLESILRQKSNHLSRSRAA